MLYIYIRIIRPAGRERIAHLSFTRGPQARIVMHAMCGTHAAQWAMEKFSLEHRAASAREKEKTKQAAAALLEVWRHAPDAANPLEDLPPDAEEALTRAAALFSPLVRHLQEVAQSGKEVDAEVLHAYLSQIAAREFPELFSVSTEELAQQWHAFLWLVQWKERQKPPCDTSDTA